MARSYDYAAGCAFSLYRIRNRGSGNVVIGKQNGNPGASENFGCGTGKPRRTKPRVVANDHTTRSVFVLQHIRSDRAGNAAASSGGSIGIGAQQGRVPADSDPGVPVHTGPHIGNEIGRANDTFEVYRGGIAYPLHSSPLWQYTAKDALKAPSVPAVEQFRKAIAATEKKQNKP